jgi:hypothetical protein
MKRIIIVLLFLSCGAAAADSGSAGRLDQLKAELDSVRHEQLAVFQNYQMIKELRRNEVQDSSPPMAQNPYGMSIDTPPPNYDDVLRLQSEREERIRQYSHDLRHLTSRFLDLDGRRKTLLRQIGDLEQRMYE